MQKTNIRDRISQRKYFLARLTKQCLQVYAECRGQLQISYLASYHVQFAVVVQPSQNRDIASQLSTYSVCSGKGKVARQLDKASMLARQIAHNTTVELHYLGSQREALSQQLCRYQVPRSPPQLGYLQLASQLPNLAWLFLGGLARPQSIYLNRGVPKWCSQLAIKLIPYPGTLGAPKLLSFSLGRPSQPCQLALAGIRLGTGQVPSVAATYRVVVCSQQYKVHLVQLFFFGLTLFLFIPTQPEVMAWNRAVTTAYRKTSPNSIGSLICSYLCMY